MNYPVLIYVQNQKYIFYSLNYQSKVLTPPSLMLNAVHDGGCFLYFPISASLNFISLRLRSPLDITTL